jgi:hypothetical protein
MQHVPKGCGGGVGPGAWEVVCAPETLHVYTLWLGAVFAPAAERAMGGRVSYLRRTSRSGTPRPPSDGPYSHITDHTPLYNIMFYKISLRKYTPVHE